MSLSRDGRLAQVSIAKSPAVLSSAGKLLVVSVSPDCVAVAVKPTDVRASRRALAVERRDNADVTLSIHCASAVVLSRFRQHTNGVWLIYSTYVSLGPLLPCYILTAGKLLSPSPATF